MTMLSWRPSAILAMVVAMVGAEIDIFFAPYDDTTLVVPNSNISALQSDLHFITTVTEAAKKGIWSGEENPFRIEFCVYNLLDMSYIEPLITAHNAGVDVQVLMDYKNMNQPYVHTYDIFKAAGLSVAANRSVSQLQLSLQQKADLDLIGIKVSGLMHMKMRYFRWRASHGETSEVVVTGSLNPENTAIKNEDTLVVIRNDPSTVAAYKAAYAAVLGITPSTNAYNSSKPVNVIFSQATVSKGTEATAYLRDIILSLVRTESEAILLSVYSLRAIADGQGSDLVDELCAARARGVAVAVITDKGQADGESGFAGGDNTLTMLRLTRCGVPAYKAKNYASRYTALHHKNAVFGVRKRSIVVTDTANWSEASVGNGTSHAKLHNAETTLVIDSLKLDDGRLGRRYLSNFLQLLRKYEYQQACPYVHAGKPVRAQCASSEKWGQPDWIQPSARNVTAGLVKAVDAAGGPGTWPSVMATFSTADPRASLLRYSVNGGANSSVALHRDPKMSGSTATVTVPLPFGGTVDVVLLSSPGAPALSTFQGLIADAAFDWNASPPWRKSSASLNSMASFIVL